nr:hypothetical protein [Sphingobium sp. CAP-1]
MMAHATMAHLPDPDRQALRRITTMFFEAFAETIKGRLSEQYRAGRILKLILHGCHAERNRAPVAPGEAFHLLAIVNHPKLARRARDWHLVRERVGEPGLQGRDKEQLFQQPNIALACLVADIDGGAEL